MKLRIRVSIMVTIRVRFMVKLSITVADKQHCKFRTVPITVL